jgi:PEP-CTERM motif-containing protein
VNVNQLILSKLLPAAMIVGCVLVPSAHAETQPVNFNVLNVDAVLPTPFAAGDNLRLNTLVTDEIGPLNQSITFTVGPGISAFTGEAAWEVSTAGGTAPRLTGVNLDLFDASNTLIASDTFVGVLGGFAHSTLAGAIGPGTYKLVATGTGVRDSSLDVTVSFAVPEPQAYLLTLAGLGVAGFTARRRFR